MYETPKRGNMTCLFDFQYCTTTYLTIYNINSTGIRLLDQCTINMSIVRFMSQCKRVFGDIILTSAQTHLDHWKVVDEL